MYISYLQVNKRGYIMNRQYKNYKFKVEEVTNKQVLEAYQKIKVYNKEVDGEILLLSLYGGGSF